MVFSAAPQWRLQGSLDGSTATSGSKRGELSLSGIGKCIHMYVCPRAGKCFTSNPGFFLLATELGCGRTGSESVKPRGKASIWVAFHSGPVIDCEASSFSD